MNQIEKQPRKNDKERKMEQITTSRTAILIPIFCVLSFVAVFFKLFDLQINQHDQLEQRALDMQTAKASLTANRGTIFDTNGDTLAFSSAAETVFISPKEIIEKGYNKAVIVEGLAEILEIDEESIWYKLTKESSQYQILKRNIEEDTADEIRAFIKNNKLSGIYMTHGSKRYYPYGNLASHVLGFLGLEDTGLYGLEMNYETQLEGTSGLQVTAKTASNETLLYQFEQMFDAKDGDNLTLTLDATVQYYLQNALEEAVEKYEVANGATGIIMNCNTGAILAMASVPTYDPNTYSEILAQYLAEAVEAGEMSLSEAQQTQWKNKCVSDTYEPGSTFKILTLSMALEENVVTKDDTFDCRGYTVVEGETIRCSNRYGHGHQDLATAVSNSCNPAFIQIGKKIGNDAFYRYMKEFGLVEKTNVDVDAEAVGFVNSEILTSELALACYSFGQNFNVTPIALLAAQAACINGGYLHTPYVVEQIKDADGKIVMQHDSTPVRQIISEETSKTVRDILYQVVANGTGKNGQVRGYAIGGKTGTADKVNEELVVSYCCFAPADDPEYIMLITLDEPNQWGHTYASGGQMAAPTAAKALEDILPYLGVKTSYSAGELVEKDATVPNVVGYYRNTAIDRLSAAGFDYEAIGEGSIVTDQSPDGGSIVPGNARIRIYLGVEKPTDEIEVPSVIGLSAEAAYNALTKLGLIVKITGATSGSSSTVRAISQSVDPMTRVAAGTVVTVQMSDNSVLD